MRDAWDADGHVDEWEGTFADPYLDPEFKDRRPTVVNANPEGTYFSWNIPGRGAFRVGSSPSSKGGVNARENVRLARWRGTMESGEFRSAAARALRAAASAAARRLFAISLARLAAAAVMGCSDGAVTVQ